MSLIEDLFKSLDEDKKNKKIIDYAVTTADGIIHVDLQPTKSVDKIDLNIVLTNKANTDEDA